MALSRVKTWIADEVLTASNLNAEFNNILNNALSLISPLTGAVDFDGKELILDGDSDTSITADTDDRIDFRIGGTDSIFFGHATGNTAGFLTVDPLAFTATANTNIARLMVAGTNALTVPAGTTAIAAGLHVAEPNLTATGTITSAVSLYVAAAPTEGGTNNYALWVDAGATQLDGAVVMASTLAVTGAVTFTADLNLLSDLIFEGATANDFETTITVTDPTADRTWTVPDSTDTFVGKATTDTLTNKTLTSPVLNTGVSGTAVLDEDDLVSDSATQLATQQSIKAYVDTTGVFTESFIDTIQTLAADTNVVRAHGLTGVPSLVYAVIRCNDAGGDAGYSQNEEMALPWHGNGTDDGIFVSADATNVTVIPGVAATGLDKGTNNSLAITYSKWDVVIRAFK